MDKRYLSQDCFSVYYAILKCSTNATEVIQLQFPISDTTPAIPTEGFRSLLQSLHTNAGIVLN
jgi:hypothetical protein